VEKVCAEHQIFGLLRVKNVLCSTVAFCRKVGWQIVVTAKGLVMQKMLFLDACQI